MKKNIIERKLEYLREALDNEISMADMGEVYGSHKIDYLREEISYYEGELTKIQTSEYFRRMDR